MAYLWMGLCVAAAIICAAMRTQRPEMATGVSLAVGAFVLATMAARLPAMVPEARQLGDLFSGMDGDVRMAMLRALGITVIGELAGQLCLDAGERALAGRVALVARVAILALCVPLVLRLSELLERLC